MNADTRTNWVIESLKWSASAVIAQWLSLDEAYRGLGIMMGIELFVGSALTIKRSGLVKWCNYYASWSIVSKIIIAGIVLGSIILSNIIGNHMARPISLAPWVAISFIIQQFITIIKKARGLDVDPPPLVDAIMNRAEKWLKLSADIIIEQDQISPTKKVTVVKMGDQKDPMVIPSSTIESKGDHA